MQCAEQINKNMPVSHYEDGIVALYMEAGKNSGFEVHKVNEAIVLVSPDYCAWSNLVLKEITPEVFTYIKTYFPKHKFYFLVDEHRDDLQKIVLDHGYHSIGTDTEMLFDISQYKPQPINQSIHVIEVDSPETLHEWCTVPNAVYADDGPCEPFEIPLQSPNIIRYLAYYNDEPVATARLYVRDEIVYLYAVTVKEEYRRRGICLALLQLLLLSPYIKNAKYVVGSTSSMAKQLYEKMGARGIYHREYYFPEK